MVMEYKNSQMAIFIKENIKEESFMEKENISGQMDPLMKELFLMVRDMDREIGNLQGKVEISILELMEMIRKVVMEDISGQMDVHTKDIFKMI